MASLGQVLADQIDGTREWTLKLLADMTGDDWSFQPGPGLAHATWLCGHLAVSQDVLIHVRCLGRGILDGDFASHFAIGRPVLSAVEHPYPAIRTILDVMTSTHDRTIKAVGEMDEALLAQPAYAADGKSQHPHYRDKLGVVTHCGRHEAFHAGQLALIRRLRGRPFLR